MCCLQITIDLSFRFTGLPIFQSAKHYPIGFLAGFHIFQSTILCVACVSSSLLRVRVSSARYADVVVHSWLLSAELRGRLFRPSVIRCDNAPSFTTRESQYLSAPERSKPLAPSKVHLMFCDHGEWSGNLILRPLNGAEKFSCNV